MCKGLNPNAPAHHRDDVTSFLDPLISFVSVHAWLAYLTLFLAALLEAGLSSEDFVRLCDQIELVWRRMGSPPRLARWVVDVLAMLVEKIAAGISSSE